MSLPTQERFKRNFLTLVDICHEMVEEGSENGVSSITPTMFNLVKIFISRLESKFLIERFIRKTHNYWDKIYEKDLDYFKELGLNLFSMADNKGLDNMMEGDDKNLAGGLSLGHVSSFKTLLSAKYKDEDGNEVEIFDDEKIQDTWKIMHGFVKQSIHHIHNEREMVDGQYTKDYFSNVNVKENAEKWKVKSVA